MTDAAAPSRRFSIAQLALIAPWVAIVIGSWGPITDNSFLWHVRAGSLQIDEGSVLTSDPFSFVARGGEWRTQSWLAEVLYGQLESWTGLEFVPYLVLVATLVTFVAIGLLVFRLSGSATATAILLVLLTLGLISFMVPRPVIFSFALFALVLMAWEQGRNRWAIPLLFWIWASLHASFAIGLVYLGLRIVADRDWKATVHVAAAGALTLATAHGLGIIEFLLAFTENREGLQFITEWRRPGILDLVYLPVLGAVVYIVFGFARRLIPWRYALVVVPFVALSLTSVRAIPPALLALMPFAAISLGGLSIGSRAVMRRRLALVFGAVVLVMPLVLAEDSDLSAERFPLEAATHLGDGPIFHDDVVGGYLIFAYGPELQVYIDDRAELHGPRLGEFVEVRSGETDWQPVFERDAIDQALLSTSDDLVLGLVDAGWVEDFSDEDFVVLSRPAS